MCKKSLAGNKVFVDASIGDQAAVEKGLENFVTAFERKGTTDQCREIILELTCGTGFPMCDLSTDIRRPLPVCREYCEYVLNEVCLNDFRDIRKVLPLLDIAPLPVPNCSVLPSMHGGDTPTCRIFGSTFNGEVA